MRGPALRPGDRVRIVSPASAVAPEGVLRGVELVEPRGTGLGEVDRALTQLIRSGAMSGVRGIALGQFTDFEQDAGDPELDGWGVVDVLRDRLTGLGVPVLGGLPAGHGLHPPTIPLGTTATIDTAAGTLTVEAAVY